MNLTIWLTVGAVVSGLLMRDSAQRGSLAGVYAFKVVTMLWIIGIALAANFPATAFYRNAIIGGLCLSVIGDVFLVEWSPRRFLGGLLSFLFAHICYIAAFAALPAQRLVWLSAGAFALVCALVLRYLWAYLDRLKIPVCVYATVIALMGWLALNRAVLLGDRSSFLALAGALLFMASDTILAFNRFYRPFRYARFWLMFTYFISQWLIAFSV